MTDCGAKKSTHKVEVVPLVLERHPNADRLSIARVFGFSCVTATDQWAGRALAAFVPPDSLVPVDRPEFAFLAKDANADGLARIKARRLRGALSFGLLVPAPAGAKEGDDVADLLGVTHYVPRPKGAAGDQRGGLFAGGEVAPAPPVPAVKYDLESGRRYAQRVFTPGEPVVVTEKLHGANARYVFVDGRMHCGSRTEWKKEFPSYDHVTEDGLAANLLQANKARAHKPGWVELTEAAAREKAREVLADLAEKTRNPRKNLWWQALDATPELRTFCEKNPGVVVYGEVYGAVQDLNYGHQKGEVSFAVFDLMKDGKFMDFGDAYSLAYLWDLPWVPTLSGGAFPGSTDPGEYHAMPFDFDTVCEMAEGKTTLVSARHPNVQHVREGVVVRPLKERYDPVVGRCVLKFVGCGYLERAKDDCLVSEE